MVPLFFGAEETFQNLNEMQVMLDEEDCVTVSEKTSALIFEVTLSYIEKNISKKNFCGLKEMTPFH